MENGAVTHRMVAANGIRLHVAECGEGPAVLLCHGFPELWYSWRHQLPFLAAAGYRALAPDQRGYGDSDRPEAVEDYDILRLSDDLVGLLDALGEERAVVVGHDWGAIVAWHLAQRVPQRLFGVAGLSVPFVPRPPRPPTEMWRRRYGDRFFYILHFQEPGVADAELDRDPEVSLRRVLWTVSGDAPPDAYQPGRGSGYLDALSEPPALPGWLGAGDLAYYTERFRRTGFTGALNWYRNFDRNWELTAGLAGRKVEVPAMFLAGERDPVLRMMPTEVMGEWVPDLREQVLVPGAGHWVAQERPVETNEVLLRFLASLGL